MRLKAPRILPLRDEEMDAETRETLKDRFDTGAVFNIFRTLARAPKGQQRRHGSEGKQKVHKPTQFPTLTVFGMVLLSSPRLIKFTQAAILKVL